MTAELPSDGRVRMRMSVAYNGASFHGFAPNKGVPTVGGTLGDALAQVLGHSVKLVCAGRTDRGVHALGQVVSFGADPERADPARIVRSVNRMCGPAIAVSNAAVASDSFDARMSCTGRVYRYRILNSPIGNPLTADFCWHVEHPLDLKAMRVASDRILGTYDFSSFCRRNQPDQSLVRTVRRAVWWRHNDVVTFEVEARSFCHQMVRSLVGMLVAVGVGRCKAVTVGETIAARDRNAAHSPAPPHGLVLWRALYDL